MLGPVPAALILLLFSHNNQLRLRCSALAGSSHNRTDKPLGLDVLLVEVNHVQVLLVQCSATASPLQCAGFYAALQEPRLLMHGSIQEKQIRCSIRERFLV